MIRRLPWLLLLAFPLLVRGAKTRQVAVVMSRPNARFQAAIEGMKRVPGVLPNVFELDRGTTEMDRAQDALRRFPFDGVVALGLPAHQFCLGTGHRRPYAATLMADAEVQHPAVLDPRPSLEDWARVLVRVLPPGAVVGGFAAAGGEVRRLEALGKLLEARGLRLVVGRLGPGRPPTRVVRRVLERERARAVFLPEDWSMARQEGALRHLITRAHALGVPVFTEAMARRFAVLSLHVPNEATGELAARRCLGLSPPPGNPVVVECHRDRARALGVEVPAEVLSGSLLGPIQDRGPGRRRE